MVHRVAGGQTLSSELVRADRRQDGRVPLFLEELTKAVVESVEYYGSPQAPLQYQSRRHCLIR